MSWPWDISKVKWVKACGVLRSCARADLGPSRWSAVYICCTDYGAHLRGVALVLGVDVAGVGVVLLERALLQPNAARCEGNHKWCAWRRRGASRRSGEHKITTSWMAYAQERRMGTTRRWRADARHNKRRRRQCRRDGAGGGGGGSTRRSRAQVQLVHSKSGAHGRTMQCSVK